LNYLTIVPKYAGSITGLHLTALQKFIKELFRCMSS